MSYNYFWRNGYFESYRDQILETGGQFITFPEGMDIGPYMKSHRMAVYIDCGRVNIRVVRNDGSIHNVMSYGKGNIIPIANRHEEFILAPYWRTEPAYGDMKAIVFSKTLLWDLMRSNQDFSERADKEIAGRLAYLTFVPVLYQDGECISRVCNYLIHLDICKNMDNSIPNTTQEELADAVGKSRSQVVRALSQLRTAGAIKTQRKDIIIKDRRILMRYATDIIKDLEDQAF